MEELRLHEIPAVRIDAQAAFVAPSEEQEVLRRRTDTAGAARGGSRRAGPRAGKRDPAERCEGLVEGDSYLRSWLRPACVANLERERRST